MAVVEYSGLIWAFALGWLIFVDHPPLAVWLGAAIILAPGMFLVAMEHRRHGR
jgi:drug/metabolite transporter (DMT)-like permease